MREKLQTMIHKYCLQNLALCLDQCMLDKGMCFVLLQWIPCILHMENRVGLKILYMLLSEGLSHVKGGQIHHLYMQNPLKEREAAFVVM